MADMDQRYRLRQFWSVVIFSLGVFWGLASLIYFPIAAVTSVKGSSWFEGGIILLGGVLTFGGSIAAFYRRRRASLLLLMGGVVLLFAAIAGQHILQDDTRGILNLVLLFLSGSVAAALGLFGVITDARKWPALRNDADRIRMSQRR